MTAGNKAVRKVKITRFSIVMSHFPGSNESERNLLGLWRKKSAQEVPRYLRTKKETYFGEYFIHFLSEILNEQLYHHHSATRI